MNNQITVSRSLKALLWAIVDLFCILPTSMGSSLNSVIACKYVQCTVLIACKYYNVLYAK